VSRESNRASIDASGFDYPELTAMMHDGLSSGLALITISALARAAV